MNTESDVVVVIVLLVVVVVLVIVVVVLLPSPSPLLLLLPPSFDQQCNVQHAIYVLLKNNYTTVARSYMYMYVCIN